MHFNGYIQSDVHIQLAEIEGPMKSYFPYIIFTIFIYNMFITVLLSLQITISTIKGKVIQP